MSCCNKCNNSFQSCGCNKKTTTTSTTTIPIPPCETDNCEEIILSECIIYNSSVECISIDRGDSLNTVFEKILASIKGYNCSCDFCGAVVESVRQQVSTTTSTTTLAPTTTTTSTSSSTTTSTTTQAPITTTTSSTTSTTTQASLVCPQVCLTYEGARCISDPISTILINGRPYYEVYGCDCQTVQYYLWYDAIGIYTIIPPPYDGSSQGYWILTDSLGGGNLIAFFGVRYSNCPIDLQETNIYLNQLSPFESNTVIGSITEDCPQCSSICMVGGQATEFAFPGERPATYICNSSPLSSPLVIGNTYYEIYDTDCTTVIAYLYRGDQCQWVVTSVLGDLNSTLYAEILPINSSLPLFCPSDFNNVISDPEFGDRFQGEIYQYEPFPNGYWFNRSLNTTPCDECQLKLAVQYNIESGSFCYETAAYTPYVNFRPHYPVYLSDGITLFGYIWYSNFAYDLLNGPGWYLTTALNDFTTVYSYLKWTDLLNPEPAPPSEPIEGGGWTWVSNFVGGVGITNTQIGCCCNCPQGFNVLPNNDGCQKITTVLPTPGTVEIPGDGVPSSEYGNLGVRIYNVDDYNLQGDSISSTYAYTNPTSFWNNRMNNALIWESGNACWPGSVGGVSCLPVGENVAPYPGTLGMCDTITLQETKTYYIGVGGDNGITIKINGVTILSQDISLPLDPLNFKYWHIYPVLLNAGTNIIEIQNTNVSNIGGFAAEIYNNTLSQLTSATDIDFVNVVFSTQSYRTGGPNEGEAFCNTYSCPEGFIYNPDSGLCTKIETLECGEQPTTTTSTTTVAPVCECFLGANLNVTTYRNGDPIPEVTDPTAWSNLTTGAWCHYNNDPANEPIYGKLYNWYAVNDPRGLAPLGYTIPTKQDWDDLISCLGGRFVAGGKMKATGTLEGGTGLWLAPNTGATNDMGVCNTCPFNGLPGGFRNGVGVFISINEVGKWWSATEIDTFQAYDTDVVYNNSNATSFNPNFKTAGFSVRLKKEGCSTITTTSTTTVPPQGVNTIFTYFTT